MTDKLIDAFAGILGLEPATLNELTSPANKEAWDSMANIMLITELEERFSVQLSTSDIESMGSIGKARTVLRRLGAEV
jgi:acyl carrier protein